MSNFYYKVGELDERLILVEDYDLDTRISALEDKAIFNQVNVMDYGAVGDGVADDNNAMQSLLATYSVIYIPSGTYSNLNTLTLRSNTILYGDGDNTILEFNSGYTGLYSDGVTNVIVANLHIKTQAANGINTNSSTNVKIENVKIESVDEDISHHGILTQEDNLCYLFRNRVINYAHGIAIKSDNVTAIGNYTYNNLYNGVIIKAGEGNTSAKNIFLSETTSLGDSRTANALRIQANEAGATVRDVVVNNFYGENTTTRGVMIDANYGSVINVSLYGITINTTATGIKTQETNGGTVDYISLKLGRFWNNATYGIDVSLGGDLSVEGFYSTGGTAVNGTLVKTNVMQGIQFANGLNINSSSATLSFSGAAAFQTNIDVYGKLYIRDEIKGLNKAESGWTSFMTRNATGTNATAYLNAIGQIIGEDSGGNTLGIYFGSGSPEGSKTANVGSLYLRTDGSTSTTLYIKETGTGNTGWVAK